MQSFGQPMQLAASPSMPMLGAQNLTATPSFGPNPLTQSVMLPGTQSLVPPPASVLASAFGL